MRWLKDKKPVELIGYALTAVSLAYILAILVNSDLGNVRLGNPFWALVKIALFGIFASSTVIINAFSWKLILEFVNGSSVSTKDIFRVYLSANIAKYLPGNVMHYAGRNYLGSKLGWKNTDMAFTSLLEYIFGVGMTVCVIILFAISGLVNLPAEVSLTVNRQVVAKYSALAILVGLTVLAVVFLYKFYVRKEHPQVTWQSFSAYAGRLLSTSFWLLSGKLFLINVGCFLINCFFYFYLCDLILNFDISAADFFNANAALSIANYTSILTPGVPGGIGVKESFSTLLLSAYGYPKDTLVVSLLIYRITCVLGDVIPFLLVKLFPGGAHLDKQS
jgi:uncharacterized membrane protein YbhN (UPF0104 family)